MRTPPAAGPEALTEITWREISNPNDSSGVRDGCLMGCSPSCSFRCPVEIVSVNNMVVTQ